MINFIMENSEEIRTIDAAIPMDLWSDTRDLDWCAYAYFKNGREGVISLPVEIAKIQVGCYVKEMK